MERWMAVHGVRTQQEWEAQQPKAELPRDIDDAWHSCGLRSDEHDDPAIDAQALAAAP